MFGICFIIVNEELDIISLKYSMLCPENIFLLLFSGWYPSYGQENLVLGASYIWIYSKSLIVYLNFKYFLLGDKGNS